MGDHFVLLVDRLLTESTLEAAIESRNPSKQLLHSENDDVMIDCPSLSDSESGLSPRKVVECRICQDEDFDSKMEIPCSCCGSLKYAHRRCVQRWCNEKGNTMCEICHQQFRPNYTAPPPLFRFGGIPMNLRGSWQISRRDLNNPRLVAMVSTDRNFLGPTYDEYADSTSRSLICCRSVAAIGGGLVNSTNNKYVILTRGIFFMSDRFRFNSDNVEFMVLLVLRHTLPILVSGSNNYSFPVFLLLLLRTSGVILPIYFILRAVTAIHHRRRRQQVTSVSLSSSDDEEADGSSLEDQSQAVHIP